MKALERLKKSYFGRVLRQTEHGYVMGDVPVSALVEVVRDYEAALVRIAELETEVEELVDQMKVEASIHG